VSNRGGLPGLDKRSAAFRRYRDIISDLSAELGGALTSSEQLQIEAVARNVVEGERLAAAQLRGEPVSPDDLARANNAVERSLRSLRTAHRLRATPKKDQTGNAVRDYLASRNGGVAA
jgi:hypothetical protein